MNKTVSVLCSGVMLLAVIGCGGDAAMEYKEAHVQGAVTFKGEPLESGKIRFIPDGEVINGQVAGKAIFADIKEGEYAFAADQGVTVGKNRIEIFSYRGTGKMEQLSAEEGEIAEPVEQIEQFIPPKYNMNSTLSIDVKEEGGVHDFDLK